ncbi:hypothetical protein T08_3719 [Trichinella sp. T8]|nr:hypothetical protein T08_3719 [Trichinella sp. T8]
MEMSTFLSIFGNIQSKTKFALSVTTGPALRTAMRRLHVPPRGSATYGSSPSDEIILPTVPNEILYPPAHSSMINRKWKIIYYSSAWMKISYRGRHTVV